MSTSTAPPKFEDQNNAVEFITCTSEAIDSFDQMGLQDSLLRGVYTYGYEQPTAIQQRAIMPLATGTDMIAQAPSGTGKTGAFTIGVLQQCDFSVRKPQAVVLSPTRELAMQTVDVIEKIGSYMANNKSFTHVFVGGTRVSNDIQALRDGNVIVAAGTPGRMLDMLKRGNLSTASLKTLVLDEADNMLSQGFTEQLYELFKYLPKDIQIALFSATMPNDVVELSDKFLRNPTRILMEKEKLSLKGIKQFYVAVEEANKAETLMDLYDSVSVAQSVIFCNTKRKVNELTKLLRDQDFTVSAIHAEMDVHEREAVMKQFRNAESRVLITTDLLARGIDVHSVNVVINFDLTLPNNRESYLHRIGRGGRFGKKGISISFVTRRDVDELQALEKHYKTVIEELPMDFATHLD